MTEPLQTQNRTPPRSALLAVGVVFLSALLVGLGVLIREYDPGPDWLDAVCLACVGQLLAGVGVLAVADYLPRWTYSDPAYAVAGMVGLAVGVVSYYCLPGDVVLLLGHIARGLVGAMLGWVVVAPWGCAGNH
jgi:hypothetical protein